VFQSNLLPPSSGKKIHAAVPPAHWYLSMNPHSTTSKRTALYAPINAEASKLILTQDPCT